MTPMEKLIKSHCTPSYFTNHLSEPMETMLGHFTQFTNRQYFQVLQLP